MERSIHRGDVFWVDNWKDGLGSEIRKSRPAVVVSNEKNNLFSPNIEICYLTTAEKKKPLPTHVEITMKGVKNTVLCENIYTVSKERLGSYISTLEQHEMQLVDSALLVSIGLSGANEPKNPGPSGVLPVSKEPDAELSSLKERCIELQAQNKFYHQLLSSFVPNFGGTAPC